MFRSAASTEFVWAEDCREQPIVRGHEASFQPTGCPSRTAKSGNGRGFQEHSARYEHQGCGGAFRSANGSKYSQGGSRTFDGGGCPGKIFDNLPRKSASFTHLWRNILIFLKVDCKEGRGGGWPPGPPLDSPLVAQCPTCWGIIASLGLNISVVSKISVLGK